MELKAQVAKEKRSIRKQVIVQETTHKGMSISEGFSITVPRDIQVYITSLTCVPNAYLFFPYI